MTVDNPQVLASLETVKRLSTGIINKPKGLFSSVSEINNKEMMKWILVKFLKDSLDFLSTNEEARKTKRGKVVEDWIDENLGLSGEYTTN